MVPEARFFDEVSLQGRGRLPRPQGGTAKPPVGALDDREPTRHHRHQFGFAFRVERLVGGEAGCPCRLGRGVAEQREAGRHGKAR